MDESEDKQKAAPEFTLQEIAHALKGLEQDLGPEPSFRPTLERMIAFLMEAIYAAPESQEKKAMVALEYRARLVLDRWKKRDAN